MDEVWRKIPETQGLYLISNFGNIYSVRYGKNIKPCVNSKGYLQAHLSINGKRSVPYVHRIVHEAFIGPVTLEHIDHIDGDKKNNRADNLRMCTRRENQNYVYKKKYPGCYYDKNTGKWRAGISVNKKTIWLGYFTTPEEAAERYKQEKEKLDGR